jgi:ATP-binding cassette subfamily B protein
MPPVWRQAVAPQLNSGENLVAWFEPDLDLDLNFSNYFVVLTDHRLLTSGNWQSWPLKETTNLRTRESAGLGTLELLGKSSLAATWQYTFARSAAANQFVGAYRRTVDGAGKTDSAADGIPVAPSVCPSCGATIEPPRTTCEACTPSAAPPPVRSLWRLGRFARPRAAMIALGFALTLASTTAGLVPPYLTIPLINDVLMPRQLNQPIAYSVVLWYLGGMLGAYLLAWILSWTKTYVLARASERIAAASVRAT